MNNVLKILTSALILTSSMSCAGTMGDASVNMIHNGFYVAGDIGLAGLVDKESHRLLPETHQLGALGLIGGGYIGYDYAVHDAYGLALEFFVDATALNAAITHEPFTYHRNQAYDLGVRLLPQYAFTPTTIGHVIFGYTNGKFNISDNGVYGYINKGYNASGFQTGLGLSTVLKDNISVRLDAVYDIYGSQTDTGRGLTTGTTQFYTNTFSALVGELSLIYKFS